MATKKSSRRDFLKAAVLSGFAAAIPGCSSNSSKFAVSSSKSKPNIILILADDLGWSELGCYGSMFNETPNIDKLAKQSMRFLDAYAPAPVCSPTRASLLTGQFPVRVGITDYLRPETDNGLSTSHVTIAEMLKRSDYATGMVGKWHLSGYAHHGSKNEVRATDHGFDEELVSEIKNVGNGANFYPYVFRDQKVCWLNVKEKRLTGKEYLVDRMNLEAVEFIQRHKDKPFFLYLSHFAPHTIVNGKEELVEKYRKKHPPGKSLRDRCYICQDAGFQGDPMNHWATDHNPHLAAMIESIDDGVGMIMDKLNELGLNDDTIVIFTSDNGGETNITSNSPLRKGKSCLYEGGIRVPMIVRWPGKVPNNALCKRPVNIMDLYPTLLEAVKINHDTRQKLDGVSFLPVLENPIANLQRDTMYWHYPLDKPHFLGGRSSGAIRKGDWKLIEFFDTGELELYNLVDDIGEKNNLADKFPKKVAKLHKMLTEWRKQVGAEIPKGQKTAKI